MFFNRPPFIMKQARVTLHVLYVFLTIENSKKSCFDKKVVTLLPLHAKETWKCTFFFLSWAHCHSQQNRNLVDH